MAVIIKTNFKVLILNVDIDVENESLTRQIIPHISLKYNITGTTRLSNNFSKRLHGLLSPVVFLILNSAF